MQHNFSQGEFLCTHNKTKQHVELLKNNSHAALVWLKCSMTEFQAGLSDFKTLYFIKLYIISSESSHHVTESATVLLLGTLSTCNVSELFLSIPELLTAVLIVVNNSYIYHFQYHFAFMAFKSFLERILLKFTNTIWHLFRDSLS